MSITTTLPELVLRSIDANWNRERWEQLPEDGNRYEVIDGVLYMTTAPSYFHQWIVRQIALALIEQLDRQRIALTTWAPIGLFMPYCDPVQPDLVVVSVQDQGIIHDRHINGIPALLVEVLSPSNPEQDTDVKRRAYARASVPEYWIVRPANRDILLCSRPDSTMGDYTHVVHVEPDAELQSPTLPFRAPVASFFAGAPDTTL
jgi:Uma2 family endonuclease